MGFEYHLISNQTMPDDVLIQLAAQFTADDAFELTEVTHHRLSAIYQDDKDNPVVRQWGSVVLFFDDGWLSALINSASSKSILTKLSDYGDRLGVGIEIAEL